MRVVGQIGVSPYSQPRHVAPQHVYSQPAPVASVHQPMIGRSHRPVVATAAPQSPYVGGRTLAPSPVAQPRVVSAPLGMGRTPSPCMARTVGVSAAYPHAAAIAPRTVTVGKPAPAAVGLSKPERSGHRTPTLSGTVPSFRAQPPQSPVVDQLGRSVVSFARAQGVQGTPVGSPFAGVVASRSPAQRAAYATNSPQLVPRSVIAQMQQPSKMPSQGAVLRAGSQQGRASPAAPPAVAAANSGFSWNSMEVPPLPAPRSPRIQRDPACASSRIQPAPPSPRLQHKVGPTISTLPSSDLKKSLDDDKVQPVVLLEAAGRPVARPMARSDKQVSIATEQPLELPQDHVTQVESYAATKTAEVQRETEAPEAAVVQYDEAPTAVHTDVGAAGGRLSWEIQEKHPMVTESEQIFVLSCMKELQSLLAEARGLERYVRGEHPRLLLRQVDQSEMLRFSVESLIQQNARNGGDSLYVQPGHVQGCGMKKVVKLEICCDDIEGPHSVCWDWDVKLESRPTA